MSPMEIYTQWWNAGPWWWRMYQRSWWRLAMLRFYIFGGRHPIEPWLDWLEQCLAEKEGGK